MSTFAATLRHDVRIQARSKLYAIGIGVAVFLGVAGRLIFDPVHAGKILAVFFLVGLGTTTYIFGASLVLYDRSQGTLQALRVTPLSSNTYVTSKVITLTAFATIESIIVYVVGFYGAPVLPIPMFAGVILLGLFYAFLGMGQVASHESLFSFLIPGALAVSLVLQLPFLYVLNIGPPILWHFIPTHGPFLLMLGGSETLPAWQWTYAIIMSVVGVMVLERWARRRFNRFVALQP